MKHKWHVEVVYFCKLFFKKFVFVNFFLKSLFKKFNIINLKNKITTLYLSQISLCILKVIYNIMSANQCSICMENYNSQLNPPYTCNPCGHVFCKVCIDNWSRSHQSCPECRGNVHNTIPNRALLELIESNDDNMDNSGISVSNHPVSSIELNNMDNPYTNIPSDNMDKFGVRKDLLKDKSTYVFYVIDNSTSMEISDGKTFIKQGDIVHKINLVTRWDEAVSKTVSIAEYNIKRGICAVYYLLNNKSNERVSDIDYVKIDPNSNDHLSKLEILKNVILNHNNIRGATPLDKITNYFCDKMRENLEITSNNSICYNIITDGEPNNKIGFENSLKKFCKNYSVFLVINLCTEDDDIVEYYNDLDKQIGSEVSGLDVLDDLESEQKEVINAGNTFLTYSNELHICRMAGCNSIAADLLDEEELPLHYINKLCKEILNVSELPPITNRVEFINKVAELNYNVYDFYYKKMKPVLNINSLHWAIWKHNHKIVSKIPIVSLICYYLS